MSMQEQDPDKELPDKPHPDPASVAGTWEEDPERYEGVGGDLRNHRFDRVD